MIIECIEINWLCKHRKKVRSSQASISTNSCTELSKTQFPRRVLLKQVYLSHHSMRNRPTLILMLWKIHCDLMHLHENYGKSSERSAVEKKVLDIDEEIKSFSSSFPHLSVESKIFWDHVLTCGTTSGWSLKFQHCD